MPVDIDPFTLDRLARAARVSGKTLGQFVEDAAEGYSSLCYRLAAGQPEGATYMAGSAGLGGMLRHTGHGLFDYSGSLRGVPLGVGNFAASYDPHPETLFGVDAAVAAGPGLSDDETMMLWPHHSEGMPYAPPLPGEDKVELSLLAHFAQRIVLASVYLSAAFAKAEVADFRPTRRAPVFRPKKHDSGWYASVVNAGFNRFWELRNALVHDWAPSKEGEPLARHAFMLLAELVPAHASLVRLYALDTDRAFHELALHLDALAEQIKLSVKLVADLEEAETKEDAAANEERLETIQDAILSEVGGVLALSAAAEQLDVTRQNLHKRIQRGSAIGVMRNGEILVPSAQFVDDGGRKVIVNGLLGVVSPFLKSGAGHWSALQFLIEVDPNLGQSPLEALKSGILPARVAHAAEAYLGLGEE